MLVKTTVTISGMTTMRIAFMKTVPNGADPLAIASKNSFPVAAAPRPTTKPSIRPTAIATCNMSASAVFLSFCAAFKPITKHPVASPELRAYSSAQPQQVNISSYSLMLNGKTVRPNAIEPGQPRHCPRNGK